MEYTIPAIPTLYNGRQYRSRLEARWAAFFDLMGWPHEYEPYDLGSWSPDFAIRGGTGPVLVEVKPIQEFSKAVADKMAGAINRSEVADRVLLVGTSPIVIDDKVSIGWMGLGNGSFPYYGNSPADWDNAVVTRCGDFRMDGQPWCEIVPGFYEDIEDAPVGPVMKIWAAATNSVQWQVRNV